MSIHDTRNTKTFVAPIQQYFSVDDSAAYLGVSPKTVRRLITSGEIKASHVGSRRVIRIHRRDLEKVLKPVPSLAKLRGLEVA